MFSPFHPVSAAILCFLFFCGCAAVFKPGKVYVENPFYSSRAAERNDVYLLMRTIDGEECELIFGKNLRSYGLAPFVISVLNESEEAVSVDFRQFAGYVSPDSAYYALYESPLTYIGKGALSAVAMPFVVAFYDSTASQEFRQAVLSEEGFTVSGVASGLATIANISVALRNNSDRKRFLQEVAPDRIFIPPGEKNSGIVFLSSFNTLPGYLVCAAPDSLSTVPHDYTTVDIVISPVFGDSFIIRVAPY